VTLEEAVELLAAKSGKCKSKTPAKVKPKPAAKGTKPATKAKMKKAA